MSLCHMRAFKSILSHTLQRIVLCQCPFLCVHVGSIKFWLEYQIRDSPWHQAFHPITTVLACRLSPWSAVGRQGWSPGQMAAVRILRPRREKRGWRELFGAESDSKPGWRVGSCSEYGCEPSYLISIQRKLFLSVKCISSEVIAPLQPGRNII